jgi:hypothetical protein
MLSSRRLANIARPRNRLVEQPPVILHRSTIVDALPSRPSFRVCLVDLPRIKKQNDSKNELFFLFLTITITLDRFIIKSNPVHNCTQHPPHGQAHHDHMHSGTLVS